MTKLKKIVKEKTKKTKTLSKSQLIKKLDSVFSIFIRLRDSVNGFVQCPLCGTVVPIKQAQNMHRIGRGCFKYRRDEINCHAGCYRCNVLLKGNYIEYTFFMLRQYGKIPIKMYDEKNQVVVVSRKDIEENIEKYQGIIDKMK